MSGRPVIGAEHVERASRRGRRQIELVPGAIVTEQARETAARLKVRLRTGPLESPARPAVAGPTALYRGLYRRNPGWAAARPSPRPRAERIGRLAIVGAGGVGGALAHLAAAGGTASEVVLIDIVPGLAESIALDLDHAAGITCSSTRTAGGVDLAGAAGADVVVITAGRPRAPGMLRSDLLQANRRTMRRVAETVRDAAPDAVVVVVSNPLDEMTAEAFHATGFPRERVIGMAGTLDSARLRGALATAAGVPISNVEAMVLGSHGDEMVPLISRARIRGQPLERFLSPAAIEDCVRQAVEGGARVVSLRKTGSANLAPAHAVLELLEHMRGARAGAVPATVMLNGEYGIERVPLGVPCHLSTKGLVEVEEFPLSDGEQRQLAAAADAIRVRLAS